MDILSIIGFKTSTRERAPLNRANPVGTVALFACAIACTAPAHALTPQQQRAFDIYKELVEINTVTQTGDTARAADAMAARLIAAGFDSADVQVFKPAPRKGNLVARLRGTGARKPILLLAHLDVVAANPADWSLDPFKLTEKDGYYYGRGTGDDKYMAASFVANLIRYKQEGYRGDRDIILALETDEETLDRDAVGIQWLLKNHRSLIDAEFALNEGGGVGLKNGKPIRNSVQTSEKVTFSYKLEVTNTARCRPPTTPSITWPKASRGSENSAFRSTSTRRPAPLSNGPRSSRARRRPPTSGRSSPGARTPLRLPGCPRTPATMRSCTPPAWRPSWKAGMPTMRCRRWRALRSIAGSCRASRRTRSRRRWCGFSPTSRFR